MNDTKRRFVELKVNEISLVDIPANEKEFAVIKRLQEETKMTVKKEEVEKVKVEVEEPKDDAVEKALEKVTDLVGDLVSKSSEEKAEEKAEEKTEEKTEDKTEEKEEDKTEEKEEEKTEEKEEEKEEEKTEEKEEEKTEDKTEEPTNKAKRFTPARMKTLETAIQFLQDLVSDLTPLQQEINSTEESEDGVEKLIEDFTSRVVKQFEKMTDIYKKLDERIEKIEKIRNPSTSLEEDGGTDKEKDIEKNFWHGAL